MKTIVCWEVEQLYEKESVHRTEDDFAKMDAQMGDHEVICRY